MSETTRLLKWDEPTEHLYETGVKNCVLYPLSDSGVYSPGVVWNGITAINESPEGAETNPVYADDQKYLNLISAEDLKATIEALYYPDEFEECDGTAELATGVVIGQQSRKTFGLCFRTTLGNDSKGNEYGYKLHLIYGCMAAPSEKAHSTISDSPEPTTFSWELSTTPVNVSGHKPTASITIDSTKADATDLAALETILYGTAAIPGTGSEDGTPEVPARLPLPSEVASIFATT